MQNVSSSNLLVSRRNKSGSPAPLAEQMGGAEQFSFYRRTELIEKKRFTTLALRRP